MKAKDSDWLDLKIQDIKKRKRRLTKAKLEDVALRKKLKDDLTREYRAAKRSEKQYIDKWIKDQLK